MFRLRLLNTSRHRRLSHQTEESNTRSLVRQVTRHPHKEYQRYRRLMACFRITFFSWTSPKKLSKQLSFTSPILLNPPRRSPHLIGSMLLA